MRHVTFPSPVGLVRAGLAVALAFALALGAALAQGMTPSHFESNGDRIAGWYWLRDSALRHTAEYGFDTVPTTGDLVFDLHVLATDRVSGGRGHDAVFDLLIGYPGDGGMGGVFKVISVTLPNVSPPDDPVGYHTRGSVTIDRASLDVFLPRTKSLYMMILRRSPDDNHIAFRHNSVTLRGGGDGTSGDGPDIVSDGRIEGDIVSDGHVGDGPDIIVDGRPGDGTGSEIVADGRIDGEIVIDTRPGTGDEDGALCLLDRPCIGQVADGFRSTGRSIDGDWYWLDDIAMRPSAEFVFETPPATGDLILDIHALARLREGSRPVDTAHILLLVGYPGSGSLGGQLQPLRIELPNVAESDDPEIQHLRVLVRLSRTQAELVVPRIGGLFLRFEQISGNEPPVAFNAASVRLYRAIDAEMSR